MLGGGGSRHGVVQSRNLCPGFVVCIAIGSIYDLYHHGLPVRALFRSECLHPAHWPISFKAGARLYQVASYAQLQVVQNDTVVGSSSVLNHGSHDMPH